MNHLVFSVRGSGAELFVAWMARHFTNVKVNCAARVTPDGRICVRDKNAVKRGPNPDENEITLIQDGPEPHACATIVLHDFWVTMATRATKNPIDHNVDDLTVAAWKDLYRRPHVRMGDFLKSQAYREQVAHELGLPPQDESQAPTLDLDHRLVIFEKNVPQSLQWLQDEDKRPQDSFYYEGHKRYWRGEFEKAIECYEKSVESFERDGNLALALRGARRFEEAEAIYRRTNLDKHAKMKVDYGHFLLSLERNEGWCHLESRFECHEPSINLLKLLPKNRIPRPYHDLDGKDIVVWMEQGLGDQLQFLRYIPELQKRGANVRVICQPILHPLLQHCPFEVISKAQLPTPESEIVKDYWIPSLSLPLWLQDFTIPEFRLDYTKKRDLPGGFKVGLAWQGDYNHQEDQWRSCHVEKFRPLADLPITLVNLQRGHTTEGIPAVEPSIQNFLDLAETINACDLVVSVDTAVGHLAGLLGKPTLLLLSWKPDWRWGVEADKTPWYRNHTLIRQRSMNDWESAINTCYERLKERS